MVRNLKKHALDVPSKEKRAISYQYQNQNA